MTEYKYVHNLKELNELLQKGYEFLSVVDPNTFLLAKEEEEKGEQEKKVEEENDNGLETNQDNAE